jgi:excisionase family DNA binding protein
MEVGNTGREQVSIFEQLLSSKEAAEKFNVHVKTMERKARSGEIPAYFKFGRWFYFGSELDAWLRCAVQSGSQSVRVN